MIIFKMRLDAVQILQCGYQFILYVRVYPDKSSTSLFTVKYRIIGYNERLLEDENIEYIEKLAAFIHALLYIILDHDNRMLRVVNTNDRNEVFLWNIASELARCDIIRCFFPRVDVRSNMFLTPEILGLEPNHSVEEYFQILLDNKEAAKRAKEHVEEYGSAVTGMVSIPLDDKSEIQIPLVSDNPDLYAKEMEEVKEKISESDIEQIMQDLKGKVDMDKEELIAYLSQMSCMLATQLSLVNRGFGSGIRELDSLRNQRKPFSSVIRRIQYFLRGLLYSGKGVPVTTNRLHRKSLGDLKSLYVGRATPHRVAVIVDVSGSTDICKEQIYDALYILLKSTDRLDVFFGDTTILKQYKRVRNPKNIQAIPRGFGTSMASIMQSLDDKGYRSLVVITDGQTDWPDRLKTKTYAILVNATQDVKNAVPKYIVQMEI